VQPTDRNLWRISLLYGVTVHDIAAASGIPNIHLIYVGQKLTIPGCGTTGHIPPPTSVPGGPGPGNPGSGQVYIVRQGDNLFRISLRYGVTVASLAAFNGIPNPNLIYIDQRIVIP
jgi:LysM repeat protein